MKIIISLIILFAIALLLCTNHEAFAHSGEDPDDKKKQSTGNALSDDMVIIKETYNPEVFRKKMNMLLLLVHIRLNQFL